MNDDKPQKEYSQSQKLRFVLYDLWTAKIGAGKMPFEEYYKQETDKFIEMILNEVDEFNLPKE